MTSGDNRQFVYDDMHHIHRLSGLFIDSAEYKITISAKPAGQHIGADSNIFINRKLHRDDLLRLKHIVRLELASAYSSDTDYYVSITPMGAEGRVGGLRRQVGGHLFPMPTLPYDCNSDPFEVTGIIVCYSEPAINYVESLRAGSLDVLVARHNSFGEPYFDSKIALLNPGNYSNWRSVLLMDHLNNNKYAHNGISEVEIAEILARSTRGDYPMLQLIHSILHLYDALYTYDSSSPIFGDTLSLLLKYIKVIPDDRMQYCFFSLLNANAGDCLVKDPDGTYVIPYNYVDIALPDKERQYDGDCGQGVIITSLDNQLCMNIPSLRIDTTHRLPNT
jgi:hypothetical protein